VSEGLERIQREAEREREREGRVQKSTSVEPQKTEEYQCREA
jgi:hypothetical protein